MALILSIPIKSKAVGTYYSYGDHEITYNDYLYGFYITSASTSGLPNDYQINKEVFEEIISSDAKGLQYDLANRVDTHGIVIADWILNGLDSYANFIFGSYANYLQATGSFIHDFIWRGATTYSWNYYFTGADPDYPGSGDYGTAYGFRFIGAAGEKFDIVLDEYGDYYGHNLVGNWTPSEDPAPTNWILINQGLDNFYVPSTQIGDFNSFKKPYIEGRTLHYFYYLVQGYQNYTEHEVIVEDFNHGIVAFSGTNGSAAINMNTILNFWLDNNHVSSKIYDNNNLLTSSCSVSYQGIHSSFGTNGSGFVIESGTNKLQANYPTYYGQFKNYGSFYNIPSNANRYLGLNAVSLSSASFIQGSGDIWLDCFSYSPNTNPQPFPENPVPITSIPEDPEDPIPDSDPDPVPGIEYPINPTPPPLRPVPSIVSGNDDLWPTVVELQDIEFDLSGYLSSLGDFEFPNINTITESFAGSIVWVSTLMSTLFNGSDFSILFAVLSSFFIVAALLGLYKWWNHK